MSPLIRPLRDFLVSLKLTIVLLVLAMVLVFIATLDQVHLGIWAVQEKYFHSFFVLSTVGDLPIPVFPGGYLIGGLLLANLIASHFYRLKLTWRKSGIWITHLGLILLLVGELLTGLLQQEFQLSLREGETRHYTESQRHNELAIIETTDPQFDEVVAIPEELLTRQSEFQNPKLPFRVVVRAYFPNADLHLRNNSPGEPPSPATAGVGRKLIVTPAPLTYKQDEVNAPAAFLELIGPDGSLGTWAVTTQVAPSQIVHYAGRTWRIGLRAERRYQPFAITLKQVRHDVYPGTDIPKNFSSLVQITTDDGHENRETLIFMNNPLRFAGLTFYQHQMDAARSLSVLQVVRNPGWLMPYISCSLITLGLTLQFCLHLAGFFRKRAAASSPAAG